MNTVLFVNASIGFSENLRILGPDKELMFLQSYRQNEKLNDHPAIWEIVTEFVAFKNHFTRTINV